MEELAVALTWRTAQPLDAAPLEETALLAATSPIVVVVELEVFQTAVALKPSKYAAPRFNDRSSLYVTWPNPLISVLSQI